MREVQVVPDAWNHRGEALVEADHPLVIWSGIPGERSFVRVVHEGRNQDLGIWVGAQPPHPHRVSPPCSRYTVCGGCALMHLDPDGQRKVRRHLVREALDAEGLEDVKLGRWHASPDGLADFRHVVKLGAGYSDAGRPRLGAWGRRDRRIVPIPKCNVASPILRKAMASVAHHTLALGIEPYNPVTERGILRAIILRASRTHGDVLVTFVVGRRVRALRALADAVMGDNDSIVGMWAHINTSTGNNLFERDEEGAVGVLPLGGRGFIEETWNGIRYRIGPGDFFQTNPSVGESLYERTLERLELKEGMRFIDLYCGVGGLALPASRVTGWAMGVEEIEGAVSRARDAARVNKVPAQFIAGRVEDVLPDLQRRLGSVSPVVTVNPARRGLEEGVVDAIDSLKAGRVAYISCNPRALARDLAAFRAHGYEIGSIDLFDMFPNTPHVECLAILEHPERTELVSARAPKRQVVRRK